MDTPKLLEKLDRFFGLSRSKQARKQEKLLKLIGKLGTKKQELEGELVATGMADETSDRYHELEQELKVVLRLIKKAKKQRITDD